MTIILAKNIIMIKHIITTKHLFNVAGNQIFPKK